MNKEVMDKVDELYKRLSDLNFEQSRTLLKLKIIKNIVESGMNDTQKLNYIKKELKGDE